MSIIKELKERNLIQDSSPEIERVLKKDIVFYIGADPTADSLHVGHLLVLFVARLLQKHGLLPVLIIGGGTGKIGDPKPDAERELLPEKIIKKNAKQIAKQVKKIVPNARVINNDRWLSKLELINFLRDIGKHFTVNNLIKKDAIKARLDKNEGLSYTEFAYPLLQAYDFYELYKRQNCVLQIGGSDQWGNIVAGIELIRKKLSKEAYGLTVPLLIDKKTGKKFGKTEGNAIWLSDKKTSVFEFYQFFVNQTDEMTEELAYKFLLDKTPEQIKQLTEKMRQNKKQRLLQKYIAFEVTSIVHSEKQARQAKEISEFLFYDNNPPKSKEAIRQILSFAPSVKANQEISLHEAFLSTNLVESKKQLKNFIKDGAVKVAGKQINDIEYKIHKKEFGNLVKINLGKKKVAVVYFK